MSTTRFIGTIRQFNIALNDAVKHIHDIQQTESEGQLLIVNAYFEQSMLTNKL